jgi:hypothetical protein
MTDIPADTRAAVRACQRELPATFGGADLAFGFDGIVDNVRVMVDTRHSPTEFDRLATLEALRDRVDDSIAAESSLTIEWEMDGRRTGGHACHLARAFNKLGAETTMIGMYGRPPEEPFTTEFAGSTLVSIGQPGFCDAVEFDDGKLLLTQSSDAASLDWETLRDRIDPEALAEHLDGTDVFGVGYWAMTAALPALVATIVEETWPLQRSPPERVFFDPGDIRSLPADTLREGAVGLAAASDTVPVTASANRSETEALADVLDGEAAGTLETDAAKARDGLGVDRFVGHSASQATTVSGDGRDSVAVPTTDSPAMTTSAGDHFNVGLLVGHLAGLSDPAATVAANAAAGVFVRTGSPPGYDDIRAFVDGYLEKF